MPPSEIRRRPLRFEIALVIVVAAAILIPGIWSYSLVDPWETHYGEVARAMLQDHDFVHTNWPGTMNGELEGFRSKPVLMFWMMASGLRAVGVAEDGGYSGEMTESARVMFGIRIPFVAVAIAGLAIMWWMLARLVSRRLAWLALLVVGSTPMFCLISRQAIPDMPLVACTIGAIAMFTMAVEDGDRPIARLGTVSLFGRVRVGYDARHVVLALAIGFVVAQAAYYAVHFVVSPQLGIRGRIPTPAIWLPAIMVLLVVALARDGWMIVRTLIPFVLIGGVIAAIVNEPMPHRRRGQSLWRHVCDDILGPWERHALDRYAVRVLPISALAILIVANLTSPVPWIVTVFVLLAIAAATVIWALAIASGGWAATNAIADRLLAVAPITTMRQLYFMGCYFLLGVSVLAKGPPGFTVVALVGVLHVVAFNRWTALYAGYFELKRGILLATAVAIPWHVAMWLKEGPRFIDEYLYTHILNRASTTVDNSPGTFEYYINQIGHGMWPWAALIPAALGAAMVRANRDTREGRVRFMIALWAIAAMTVFCMVQTKFHHYILPALPPLALLVACFLDDLVAKRERLHAVYAAVGIGIVLLITRDLMAEPERWIEMFVFRYDRPWPGTEPYSIDPSDGFLALGLAAAIALVVAATRWVRTGVAALCLSGLAICVWSLQVYMPLAGTHWGMREAVTAYYAQRTIYGEKLVYFGAPQLADEWADAGDTRTFETAIPDALQLGQPMTITIQINKAEDERIVEHEIVLSGTATAIGDHSVEVTLLPNERAKLAPTLVRADEVRAELARIPDQIDQLSDQLDKVDTTSGGDQRRRAIQSETDELKRRLANVPRAPIRAVDADRLIAWQLYWRGEQFWSGGEIWSWLPEMKVSFPNTNNVEFLKYINDRSRAPLGRRYFVITEASRITSVRASLPTQRARDSFEIVDTTSNKFSIAAFFL